MITFHNAKALKLDAAFTVTATLTPGFIDDPVADAVYDPVTDRLVVSLAGEEGGSYCMTTVSTFKLIKKA